MVALRAPLKLVLPVGVAVLLCVWPTAPAVGQAPPVSPASKPPPATKTPQSYPPEQINAGEARFVGQCGFCHGREHGAYGWAGANSSVYSRAALRAIEYQTGRIRWSHDIGEGAGAAGVLTTTTGVTFSGDNNNNALALRTTDGATLWHSTIGRVGNSPISYELDGRQFILFGGGSTLYAFALPEAK